MNLSTMGVSNIRSAASEATAAHFDRLALRWGDDVRAADWSSSRSQELRFEALLELGDFDGARLLDVGCGRGDFLTVLDDHGIQCVYIGLDLSKEAIRLARLRHPQAEFRVGDVLSAPLGGFDYLIGSGIHSVRTGNNEERARRMIKRMWDLSIQGMGTNMLSKDRPVRIELATHAFAYSPVAMEAFARTLTAQVRVKRNYLPHDFTLLLNRLPRRPR